LSFLWGSLSPKNQPHTKKFAYTLIIILILILIKITNGISYNITVVHYFILCMVTPYLIIIGLHDDDDDDDGIIYY
jgi:hypothetical protein